MTKADISLSLRCDSSPEAQAKVRGGGGSQARWVSIVDGTRAGRRKHPGGRGHAETQATGKGQACKWFGSARAEGKAADEAGKASKQWPLWGPGHVPVRFTSPLRNARSRFDCLWTVDGGVEKKKAKGVTLGFR